MGKLVFLDTNVFVWAYNRTDSNSAKILDLMDEGRVSVLFQKRCLKK